MKRILGCFFSRKTKTYFSLCAGKQIRGTSSGNVTAVNQRDRQVRQRNEFVFYVIHL